MDYRQTEGSATSWRRSYQVIVNNPRNGAPSVIFHEEDRVNMNGVEFAASTAPTSVTATFDPEASIPLLNPETGEPTGTSLSQRDLYVTLFSLYMQLARARDSAPPPQEPPPLSEPVPA
jgi:hypothetical protein